MTTVTLDQALSNGYGVWRSFTCPVHPDTNPSARVNTISGKWVCMVCHARGTTEGYVPDPINELDAAMALLDEDTSDKPESWLDQYDFGSAHPYWLSRFSESVCSIFRLGWDGIKEKPCYPLRNMAGRPIGVVHRSLDNDGPKYKYPKGARTSELLFGAYEATQTKYLFVVEGAMDVVAVREVGFDAVGTYGARLYEYQAAEIVAMHPTVVYLAYDMDRAGRLGADEAIKDLNDLGIYAVRVTWDDKFKDLGEMDIATRQETLSKALASISTQI